MSLPGLRLPRPLSLAPVQEIAKRVNQWLPQGPSGLTILSVDGQWFKLIHLIGRQTSRTVTTLIAKSIEGMSDEDLVAWLKGACAAKGFEPGPVLIANPSQLTTARVFTLPSTNPAEIRDIVNLQAEKHTPYAKEEILTDFRMIESDRSGYSRVLLVISHQDIVLRGLRLVEAMGWSLDRVGFAMEGLVNWFRASSDRVPQGGTLVAELDSETTTLVILHGDKPYFHRSLTLGTNQLTRDPAEGLAKLVTEFQRSLETFEAEGLNVPVAGILLTGQVDRLPDLKDRVQQNLNLPTTVIAPFERCSLADASLTQDEAVSRVSFASLLGLGLGPSEIDLTPKTLKLHRAFEVRVKALVELGCQAIGCLLLVSCLIIEKAYKSERYHASLLREYQVTAQQVQDIEQSLDRMKVLKEWLKDRDELLDIVSELTRQTPPDIRWESLTFTKGEQVTLKGVSTAMPKVFDFVEALKTSPLFTHVESRHVVKRKIEDQDMTEFEVLCSFTLPTREG